MMAFMIERVMEEFLQKLALAGKQFGKLLIFI
jgi:hypothetical protein